MKVKYKTASKIKPMILLTIELGTRMKFNILPIDIVIKTETKIKSPYENAMFFIIVLSTF